MAFDRNKALPELPLDHCASSFELLPPSPSEGSTSSESKALPAVRVEETLSKEEMDNLRDCWNISSKGTSVHRKRQLGQHMKFPPPPIILPDATEGIPASALSTPNQALPESRSRKLWDLLKGKCDRDKLVSFPINLMNSNTPTSPSVQKTANTLQSFRSKAQHNLLKRLKNATSTPEIGGRANVTTKTEVATAPPVPTLPKEVAPDMSVEKNRALTQEELMIDDGGIYLTIDSDWRNSRGEAVLTFLSPIPQDYDPFRPDSPILHRHRSLCDLATLIRMQEPNVGTTTVHPIDELHSFIMLLD